MEPSRRPIPSQEPVYRWLHAYIQHRPACPGMPVSLAPGTDSLAEITSVSDARHRKSLRGTPFWHDGMRTGSAIMAVLRDNSSMRQLQFFTTAELGRMRDRTASRNHSPERDEFRRLHAHHRAWGLVQRHGRRLHHLRTSSCTPRPARTPEHGRQDGDQAPPRLWSRSQPWSRPWLRPRLRPWSRPWLRLRLRLRLWPGFGCGSGFGCPAEQRQRSTPAACEQRRSPARNQPTPNQPARNQPTRDQHVSASQKPAPPPPHPGPAMPPARPSPDRLPAPGTAPSAVRASGGGGGGRARTRSHRIRTDPRRNRRHPRHRADQAAIPRPAGPHRDHHDTVIDKAGKGWQASRSTPIRTR